MTSRKPSAVILVENLPVPLDRRAWQEALALHEAGWDVTVISPRGSGEMRRLRDRDRRHRGPALPATRGARPGRLSRRVPAIDGLHGGLAHASPEPAGRIDVIHGCNPPDLFWLFGRLARRQGGAYVFDQHDVGPELATTKWGGRGPRARSWPADPLARAPLVPDRRARARAERLVPPDRRHRVAACRPTTSSSSATRPDVGPLPRAGGRGRRSIPIASGTSA